MYRKFIISALLLLTVTAARGQSGLTELLQSVEQNNLSLQAAREKVKAQSLEARMGNSLDDLSVAYEHMWGNSNGLGQNGELTISQEFQFPTVYARRNKLARNLGQQYDNQYLDLRQRTLLEAKELYIELQMLYRKGKLLKERFDSNASLKSIYDKLYTSGDATVLDKRRIDNELLTAQENITDNNMRVIEVVNRLRTLNGGEAPNVSPDEWYTESIRPYAETLSDYETYAPQLLAYKLQEKGSELDLKVSRAQAIPKIELGYRHEYGTADRDRFNGVTTGLSIPIFSNRHNVKRAKAEHTAAILETRAATVEMGSTLSELYSKAETLAAALARYEESDPAEEYRKLLSRALDAGEINMTDYYSELYSYYEVLEAKYRIEADYLTVIARINMIYL